MQARVKTSLRRKLIVTTAMTLLLVSVGTISVVAYLQLNLSRDHLNDIESRINSSLEDSLEAEPPGREKRVPPVRKLHEKIQTQNHLCSRLKRPNRV